MEGRFIGRDIINRPACPFCGAFIEQPKELATRTPHEMPVGRCACGAVYACDVTGHNLGTAMIEALVFGCNGDWDLAWSLLPEDDYLEERVEKYDLETHLIVHSDAYQGRRVSGVLFFIRLHDDIREVTDEGTQKQLKDATPVLKHSAEKKRGRKKAISKKEVEALVREYDVKSLLALAGQDKRIVRFLQRLLYSVETLGRWKAADLLGQVSANISRSDPRTISRLLQGLFTSLTDTAASSWGSLDAIGEIISNSPEQFKGYLPQIYQFTNDRALLPEVLRALANIAFKKPDLIRGKSFYFIPLLRDDNPKIRGYTAVLLGRLKAREARDDLENLLNDPNEIETYKAGRLEKQTISDLASMALAEINAPNELS